MSAGSWWGSVGVDWRCQPGVDVAVTCRCLSVTGRCAGVDLRVIGLLVHVESVMNAAQLCTERTTARPVRILAAPQTAPAAQRIVDPHCRQSAAFCRPGMTAASQELSQSDQRQTADVPAAWSGRCRRKLLRGPIVPAGLLGRTNLPIMLLPSLCRTRHAALQFLLSGTGITEDSCFCQSGTASVQVLVQLTSDSPFNNLRNTRLETGRKLFMSDESRPDFFRRGVTLA